MNTMTRMERGLWLPVLALSSLLALGLVAESGEAAPTLTFAPSIRIDRRSDAEGAGWGPIAIDGEGNIYADYYGNTPNGFAMYFNRSTDGGVTFEASDQRISGFGWNVYPSIAADSLGHVYAVWEDGGRCFNRSTDGGATFEGPKSPSGGDFCGIPQIATDDTGGVYVARHNFRSIIVDVSHDFGASFNAHTQVSGLSRAVNSDVATDGQGNVYVVFGNADGGDENFYFTRSTDRGETWNTPEPLGRLGQCLRFWRRPSVAAVGDRVYVAWTRGGEQFDVLLRVSADRGATFGPEVTVNGTTPQPQATDCPPNPAVVGEGDQVYVAWTTQEAPHRPKLWLAPSPDGGAHFDVPVRVDDSTDDVVYIAFGDGNLATKTGQIFASYNTASGTLRFTRTESPIPEVKVNAFVTFEPIPSTFTFTPDPSGCPAGFVGTFSFEARLTNISESSLTDLVVVVTTLTNGNLLQNADGGPGSVGARLTVPQQDGFSDGFLSAEEFVDVPFAICIRERSPFRFFVDVLGVAGTPEIPSTAIQNPDNGHWYLRYDTSMGWHESQAFCENQGGYLATITSQTENSFVYANLAADAPTDEVWLGGTDQGQEGFWRWISGETWTYENWAGGEPNNCGGSEHFLTIFTPLDPVGRAGFWNDSGTGENGRCDCSSDCDISVSMICEWDSKNPRNTPRRP